MMAYGSMRLARVRPSISDVALRYGAFVTADERRAQWIAAGLYDPASPRAGERLELLDWIAEQGVTLEQMTAACAVGQLIPLVGDLSLRPGLRMTLAEAADATGLALDEIMRIRRASGFADPEPDERVLTEADVAMFDTFRLASKFFSVDELVHFVRVVGGSVRRIAEAAGEMFLRDVEAGLQDDGTELDRAKANVDAVQLVHAATQIFDPLFRTHLELSIQTNRMARAGTDDYSTVPLTVGFVDLNGFTARSGELPAEQLLQLVITFEAAAVDLVSEHGGRLVKLIGDEVMFSTVGPDAACSIASELIERAGEWGSGARGGVAQGPVITSGGDIYGETVNLASRIADIAVPGELLVNDAVADRARQFAFEPAGRRQLKGFADPVRLWSLQVG